MTKDVLKTSGINFLEWANQIETIKMIVALKANFLSIKSLIIL